MKLTKSIIDRLLPSERDTFHWDAELKGFGLRISPSGTKTYVAQYRLDGGRSGRTRRYSIGRHGVLTPEEARREAKRILALAAVGEDPSGDRTLSRRELSVADLIERYDGEGTQHLKARERRQRIARLKHHVIPLLGMRRVSEVRVADVEDMMRQVASGKTAIDVKTGPRTRLRVRGGEGAATKAVRDLSSVFSFAVRLELMTSNPCTAVRKRPDQKRNRYLSQDELQRFGQALKQLEEQGANPKGIRIIRLLALTGCRRNEIAALRWSEVDLERSCLRLEDSKTGRSVRPLASSAAKILSSVERDEDSPYVFPAERGDGYYQGMKKVWRQVVALANLPGVTPHTLRHTVGSWSVSLGESLPMAGAILGHSDPRATAIYAHMQAHSANAAVDRVISPIARAIDANR